MPHPEASMHPNNPKRNFYSTPWVWAHVQRGARFDITEYRQARFLGSTYCTKSGVPFVQDPPHRHFGHDLLVASHGVVQITVEDQATYTLAPGTILIVPGGNGHRRVIRDTACCCGIEISPDFFYDYLDSSGFEHIAQRYTQRVLVNDHDEVYRLAGTPQPVTLVNDHRAYRTFLNLFEECLSAYNPVTSMRSHIVYTFGSLFTQFLLTLLTQQLPVTTRRSTARRLQDVKLWLDRHYAEEISISRLAQKTNLSPHWFSTAFASAFGQSPKAYLISLRLGHAAYLLAETELSVTEIAHRIGYNDLANFIRAFERRFHLSPQRYRNDR